MSDTSDAVYLGRALAAARSARGMKRMDLKEKSQVSYPYIAEIENGGKYPSQAVLTKLADALGLTPFELQRQAEALAAAEREGLPLPDAEVASTSRPDFVETRAPVRLDVPDSPDALGDDLVDRVTQQVLRAVEPRMVELLSREIRYAVREELLRQREGR